MTSFPTPSKLSLTQRDRLIHEACYRAAQGNDAVMQMARLLAKKIPNLGVESALRLLAAIGIAMRGIR